MENEAIKQLTTIEGVGKAKAKILMMQDSRQSNL